MVRIPMALSLVTGASLRIANLRRLLGRPEDAVALRALPESQGPGNILPLVAAFERVAEVVNGSGKLGVSAERGAQTAWDVRRVILHLTCSPVHILPASYCRLRTGGSASLCCNNIRVT